MRHVIAAHEIPIYRVLLLAVWLGSGVSASSVWSSAMAGSAFSGISPPLTFRPGVRFPVIMPILKPNSSRSARRTMAAF